MISKETSVDIKWPFKVADFQYGSVGFFEKVIVEEGEDPDRVREILFEKLKDQVQEKIGQALEEVRGGSPSGRTRPRRGQGSNWLPK